jgi:FAD/FMN-containing dehydrogenase
MVSTGSEDMAKMGGFFSRPYGPWKDTAYRRAVSTLVMQRKIKQIFDPKGILNPGKLCF